MYCTTNPGADKLWGGSGNDVIYGGSNGAQQTVESIYGGKGNDKLYGEAENDDLFGQAGKDEIQGGDGDDYLFAGQTNVAANTMVIPGQSGDKLTGGQGKDTFDCGGLDASIIQDFDSTQDKRKNCILPTGTTPMPFTTPPGSINNIQCSSSAPGAVLGRFGYVCTGTDQNDQMTGDSGKNEINGKLGDDIMKGGLGDDFIEGDSGNDKIDGGDGDDVIQGGFGADTIKGGEGNDKIYHRDSRATSPDNSIDIIDCGPGQDEVWINTQSDVDSAINCEG